LRAALHGRKLKLEGLRTGCLEEGTMPAEDEVRAASRQFYAALNSGLNGDVGPMADVWSRETDATTMHPNGGRQVGWDQVWGSWQQVAGIASSGSVALGDQLIRVIGDTAYELGTERVDATFAGSPVRTEVRVTNIYRREAGAWRIVHHHADAVPEMQDGPRAGSS
jgi:ketosteroid isomerase-like protein